MLRLLLPVLAALTLGGCVIQTTGTLPRTGSPIVQPGPDSPASDFPTRLRWRELTPGVAFEAVAMQASGRGWLVGKVQSASGKAVLRRTEDGGVTWAIQDRGRLDLLAVAALGETTAVAVGRGGVVFRTDDGGARWTLQDAGTDEDLVAVGFGDMSRGYALTGEGTLITTTDGGRTWTPRMTTGADHLQVLRDGTALLHDDRRIMHWGPYGLAHLGTISGLVSLHAVDDAGQELWAIGSGNRLLQSMDGGNTWDSVMTLATQDRWLRQPTAQAMAFGAEGRGMILSRTGMLTTLDGGQSWLEGDIALFATIQPWLHLLEDGSALAGSRGRTLWRLMPY